MLYHASQTPGLTELIPHRSTHKIPYVYAIRTRVTALCFGAPKDDFDLLMDEEKGIPELWECYPGAFQRVYGGKSCSLYAVSEEDFLEGQTGWEPELVCPHAVTVVREEKIPDLFAALRSAADQGLCTLHEYSEDAEYQAMLREELGSRIRSYGLTQVQLDQDPRFVQFLNQILRR